MTMHSNGTGEAVLEDESHLSNPEWESPYSNPEHHEDEWEAHFSNPETHESAYSNPYSPESSTEDEQEGILGNILGAIGLESEDYSNPETHEDEWEVHEDEWETHYSNPEAHEWETHYSNPEAHEWETHYSNPEAHERANEPDRFLPFLAPLAMKALPLLGKAIMPMAKKLLPHAGRAVSNVLRGVLGGGRRRRRPMPARPQFPGRAPMPAPSGGGWAPRPRPARPPGGWAPRPAAPSGGSWAPRPTGPAGSWGPSPVRPGGVRRPGPGWRPGMRPRRPGVGAPLPRSTVAGLFRQLSRIFGEGESEATHLEAQLFGANEMEGELASHEAAHEAAVTEVLAAEATHTETESEAEALLGTALPITIRIMGGGRGLRRITPTLVQANARLVRSIRNSGPAGPQLLRVVPAIQRRTVASLRAAQRAGRPLTPGLVSQVMAGQAARVLATPRICGPALVRNAAIRQATVGRPGQVIRPRRPLPR